MEDVIGKEVMTLSLLFDWLTKQKPSQKSDSIAILNEWLEKVTSYSRPGTVPPDQAVAARMHQRGLEWKPSTHRWIRREKEHVRERKIQPRLDEIKNYIETGGFTEVSEKLEDILLELFPDMLNPKNITRIKAVDSIQEKESRKKFKEMPKEKAVQEGIITEDEEWDGMKYNHFTDIVGGRVNFNNAKEVMSAVTSLRDKAEKSDFEIIEEDNRMEKPLDGYYRRYHMLLKMTNNEGKTITVELQLGTANQTKVADWSHDLLHKKGADRPILTDADKRTALKYIRQMAELYAYHDGIEGAKNVYPAECVEVIRKFAGCLEVPES